MAGNLLPIRPFLDNPGSMPVPFSQWLSQFDVYLLATGLQKKDNATQLAVLKHSLGVEGQRIFATLPGSSSVTTVTGAVELLRAHFEPRHNMIAQWVKFITLEQRSNQSVNDFVSSLREQAALCDFGELHDRMIAVMIGAKAADQRIRTAILQDGEQLSLARVLERANAIETASRDAREIDKALAKPPAVHRVSTTNGSTYKQTKPRFGEIVPNYTKVNISKCMFLLWSKRP